MAHEGSCYKVVSEYLSRISALDKYKTCSCSCSSVCLKERFFGMIIFDNFQPEVFMPQLPNK